MKCYALVSGSIIFLFATLLSIPTACNKHEYDRGSKELIVLLGCDDVEILSDIEYSVTRLDSFFNANGIVVKVNDTANDCGYILVRGRDDSTINTVLTDIDLVEKCRGYFKLK